MTSGLQIDYKRLHLLSDKANKREATKAESDELMEILHQAGSVTDKIHSDYKAGRNREDIIGAAATIGAFILLGYMLSSKR